MLEPALCSFKKVISKLKGCKTKLTKNLNGDTDQMNFRLIYGISIKKTTEKISKTGISL